VRAYGKMTTAEEPALNFRKSFLKLLSANAIAQFIPIVALYFLGRQYAPAEIAQFSSFVALATIFGIISIGRVDAILPIIKDKMEAIKVFNAGFFFLFVVSITLAFFLYLYTVKFWYYVPFAVFGIGLNALLTAQAIREKSIHLLGYSKIIMTIVNSGIAVTLGFLNYSVEAMIWAWILSYYVSSLAFLSIVYKKNLIVIQLPKQALIHLHKSKLGYSTLHSLADAFFGQYLLFVAIAFYYGEPVLGLFAFMFKYVKAPIILVSSSVSPLFLSETASLLRAKISIRSMYYKTIKSSLFFAVPFCVILFFGATWIFEIWCGPQWTEAGKMAQYLLPTLFLSFVYSPISILPILLEKFAFNFYICLATRIAAVLVFTLGHYLQVSIYTAFMFYNLVYIIFYIFMFVWGERKIRALTLSSND
jgi:O-antigen/teichoic acid export membrane protein